MNFWLIFVFAPNYLGSRTISTLRPRKSKVERERSVKNWGKNTFTFCAFARRCDPGPLYAIMPTPVDSSRLRIKGNSLFCLFVLSHKQRTQLGTLLRIALAYKGFNWPFFFVLVNLASIRVQSTGRRERTRDCEPRRVPLARDFPRCPPRGECAHRLWRNISSMRRSVLSPDETLTREFKIQRVAEYLWRTSRCFIWWLNTVSNAWYYFSNKMILDREIKDAKMSSFSSDFKTLTKH